MSSATVAPPAKPPEPVPLFPLPELSVENLALLEITQLREFCDKNANQFKSLVTAIYVGFVEQTAGLRKLKPTPESLYDLFCSHIYIVLPPPA
ncbi:unnamed protein product, partial [marine sediment metagenome]